MNKFNVLFLTEAREFLLALVEKIRDKITFNIDEPKIKNYKELGVIKIKKRIMFFIIETFLIYFFLIANTLFIL